MDMRDIGDWSSSEQVVYLERALSFIIRYKWLHDFKIIRFYIDNIHEHLPREWVQAFSGLSDEDMQNQLDVLRNASLMEFHETFPESLRAFLTEAKQLCLQRTMLQHRMVEAESEIVVPRRLMYGMSQKKHHEVSRMAVLVHQTCQKHGLRTILDLGAGMGYLDSVLADVYGYQVIAVESNDARAVKAQKRLSRHSHKDRPISDLLKYEAFGIDSSAESFQKIRNVLRKQEAERVCFIGLHCCGNFTPIILDLFAKLAEAKALVCVGCCYHLMQYSEDQSGVEHCPLSAKAKEKLEVLWKEPRTLLTTASLRLATQETKVRSLEELEAHVSCHHFRAVLEVVADSKNYGIRKKRRHTSPQQYGSDVEKFIGAVFVDYEITGCENQEEFRDLLREVNQQCSQYLPKLRTFRILQGLIQDVLETFIAADRLIHMKTDLNIPNASICSLFDEAISPRNLAILGMKYCT